MKKEILSLSSAIQKNKSLETFNHNLFLNRLQVLPQEAGMLLNKKGIFWTNTPGGEKEEEQKTGKKLAKETT